MRILSFDLGDFNCLSAWHMVDTDTGEVLAGDVSTTEPTLSALIATQKPDRVLCEACTMTMLLADLVAKMTPAPEFCAANTNAEAWRWSKAKRKTDASDAQRLVRLDLLNELEPVYVPDMLRRSLRRLLRHRQSLVSKRTAVYNSIRYSCKMHEISLAKEAAAWTPDGIARLKEFCTLKADQPENILEWDMIWRFELAHLLEQLEVLNKSIKACDQGLQRWERNNEQIKRLKTAPGIGTIVATALIAFIGDPKRFGRGKHVASYAGLVPRVYQSGTSCRHGQITKAGCRLLRTLLINAAWQALRHDKWAKELFDRVCGGSKKRRKQAVVAVARKLLIRCWAMMRDEQSWPQETESPPLAA